MVSKTLRKLLSMTTFSTLLATNFFLTLPSESRAAPGDVQVSSFTESGTFLVPNGVQAVEVLLVGAGGSGGKGNTNPSPNNGGGGGGGMVLFGNLSVTPGDLVSFTIRAQGATTLSGGGQVLTAAAGYPGNRPSGCYAGSGGYGYTGVLRVLGTSGSQSCYGSGGDGGGAAIQTSFTGTELSLGGGGKGGSAGRVGLQGAGVYGYGGGGGTSNGSDGTPGGPGLVAFKWVQPNNEAQITSFSLPGQMSSGLIDPASHTVRITLPNGSSRENLAAAFVTSPGATARVAGQLQASGATLNDFTAPLTYLIRAQDGTEIPWTVSVKVEQVPLVISGPSASLRVGDLLRVYREGGSGGGAEAVQVRGAGCLVQDGNITATEPSSCSVSITKLGDDTFESITSNEIVVSFVSAPGATNAPDPAPEAQPIPNVTPEPTSQPGPIEVVTASDSPSVSPTSSSTASPASTSPPVAEQGKASPETLSISGLRVQLFRGSAKVIWPPIFLPSGVEVTYQVKFTDPNSNRFGPWRSIGSANMRHLRVLKRNAVYVFAVRAVFESSYGPVSRIQFRVP
jgi:hypothetical protein